MAIPTDGLIFYAPLEENKATDETGKTIESFDYLYESFEGRAYFRSNENSYLIARNLEELRNSYNSGNFSCSFWSLYEGGSSRGALVFLDSSGRTNKPLCFSAFRIAQGDSNLYLSESSDNNMHHFVISSSNFNAKIYRDGEFISSFQVPVPSIQATNALYIGGIPNNWVIGNPPSETVNKFLA